MVTEREADEILSEIAADAATNPAQRVLAIQLAMKLRAEAAAPYRVRHRLHAGNPAEERRLR